MKVSLKDSGFNPIYARLSQKTSRWMRLQSEQLFAAGKKINCNQNFQVGDKVKLINRLMNRIMAALGLPEGVT